MKTPKRKSFQVLLDIKKFHDLKTLIEEEGLTKEEFILMLLNHIEDTRKILRKGKQKPEEELIEYIEEE